MNCTYEDIRNFMISYFQDYTEKAQDPVLQKAMDKYYAPDVMFDDGVITSRQQWYKACLSHPGIVDVLTVKKLCIDDRMMFVGAMVTSRPTERETGKVLLEIGMNAFYTLGMTEGNKLSIRRIEVFLESNPEKGRRMMEIYGMKH